MDKLKIRKEIEELIKKNNSYMLFNIIDNNGTITFEPFSFEEFMGESFPEAFD